MRPIDSHEQMLGARRVWYVDPTPARFVAGPFSGTIYKADVWQILDRLLKLFCRTPANVSRDLTRCRQRALRQGVTKVKK
jgi:hypothetical protein